MQKSQTLRRFLFLVSIISLSGLFVEDGKADVSVPSIFADHAVLQAGEKTPVWGWAEPGEPVKVSLGTASAETKAGTDGKWRVELSLKEVNSNSQSLTIEGKNKLTFNDILVGEVWVCSGQSNMEWILKNTLEATEEIAQSANPMIRQFLVRKSTSPTPVEKSEGKWTSAAPETSGDFTAVGYYFAKKIQKELQCPVALVHSSWGGTPVEAWVGDEGFKKDPTWNAGKEKQIEQVKSYPAVKAQYATDFKNWVAKNQRVDKRMADQTAFAGATINESEWVKIKLPGEIVATGLPLYGAIWMRRPMEVPAEFEGKDLKMSFGNILGLEEIYWNGEKVWSLAIENFPGRGGRRDLTIPGKIVKPGANTVAIRLYAPLEKPQITGEMRLGFPKGSKPLAGDWFAKAEYELPAANEADPEFPKMFSSIPAGQNTCTFLYNGMIHTWIGYGIRGVNWYQGEANVGRAVQYKTALGVLIQDWRDRWGQGDFFFNICQLANYLPKKNPPEESQWAELRDSQYQVTKIIPKTGIANLIDVGEEGDIHPRNKKDVGERLALNALAQVYGKKVVDKGPTYDSMKVEGDKVRITFQNTDGGLIAKPLPETYWVRSETGAKASYVKFSPQSELQGFVICGEDKKWKWADAKIENNSIVVWSTEVPLPTAVRYAWADNPTCNLYNGAGLPALSFRTDSFPLTTEGKNL